MTGKYQCFGIQWGDFVVEVRYCAGWSACYEETYGYALAHLEIETIRPERSPLPVSETSYRSPFDLLTAQTISKRAVGLRHSCAPGSIMRRRSRHGRSGRKRRGRVHYSQHNGA